MFFEFLGTTWYFLILGILDTFPFKIFSFNNPPRQGPNSQPTLTTFLTWFQPSHHACYVYMFRGVCVCVCVCVREREGVREREIEKEVFMTTKVQVKEKKLLSLCYI
jgi:hypothetical protein